MEGWNYFSYYSEIEEYFWKKRGAHLLVSPLDWAIMETWQRADIPLSAVLKGIDRAFEAYQRSRRGAGRPLKSLAYCTDAVIEAAEEEKEAGTGAATAKKWNAAGEETFSRQAVRAYVTRNLEQLRRAAERLPATATELRSRIAEIARSLEDALPLLDSPGTLDLEDFERRMTVLDDKLHAELTARADTELMLGIRRELDRQLSAYRSRMTAEQLAEVDRQFIRKRLLEEFFMPRMSLYYFS
jgi:hypothetical protein